LALPCLLTKASRAESHSSLGPSSYWRERFLALPFTAMLSPTAAPQGNSRLVPATIQRRSLRVLLSVPIHVRGKDGKNRKFDEDTRTLVANAHGALISHAAAVVAGQQVTVSNEATHQSRDCRVVYLGDRGCGKIQMGIEFVKPSPTFWQMDFPPDDWAVPED
jgi:hypothetical protein